MGFLSVIRRWALRDEMPIREIARRTGLSRNTIKKYLREGVVEPKFKSPPRCSKLDPYADRLSAWLLAQTRKPRKERCSVKKMYEDLVELGYDGSYGRVAAFARAWRADRQVAEQTTGRGTFVPLIFEPGEAFQFDWSEDWATIGGERVKLQVAHTKLSHSRAFLVRAYLLQTHEMLFDAHWHAFRVFGGVPGRGIYDNMKTALSAMQASPAGNGWTGSGAVSSAISTRASAPWQATTCLSRSSATLRRAGRRARSRRAYRTPGTAFGRSCRSSIRWTS